MVYARGLIPAHAGKTTDHWCTSRCSGAHPRSRGENPTLILTIKRGKGSSPLTRGKLRPARARPPVPRLIPAHAGKTSRVVSTDGIKGAHPRSRGENGVVPMLGGVEGGSSPLTRGKRLDFGDGGHCHGLIPAHAGKTEHATPRRPAHGAHPRSRGENAELGFQKVGGSGSSPLTRGKPTRASRCLARLGLIPAHAGKTQTGNW